MKMEIVSKMSVAAAAFWSVSTNYLGQTMLVLSTKIKRKNSGFSVVIKYIIELMA